MSSPLTCFDLPMSCVLAAFSVFVYAGSTTPTQFRCGGPDVYCPGTTPPISLIGNTAVYSIPGTGASATTQTGTALCPFQRLCANGSLAVSVVNSGACASGSMSATLLHLNSSYTFGSPFTVVNQANPTYNGIMVWTITGYSNGDAGCPATSSYFSINPVSTYSSMLSIGATAVSLATCPSGMTITLTSARAGDLTQFSTCTVSVSVAQVRATVPLRPRLS